MKEGIPEGLRTGRGCSFCWGLAESSYCIFVNSHEGGSVVLSPLKRGDLYVLENQMGRFPRGVLGVVKRCKYDYPQVIATHPLLEDEIFPTFLWLTCPALVKELNVLESEGWVRRLEERLRHDTRFQERLREAHKEYARMRRESLSEEVIEKLRQESPGSARVVEESGIGGTMRFAGIKCLHMHIADYLGRGDNAVGEALKKAFPSILEPDSICGGFCARWGEAFKRYGAIDVGTNSTRLLIAELYDGGALLEPVLHKVRITRFGEGVNTTHFINEKAAHRTLDALREYSADLKRYMVQHVMAVATSAARDGENAEEVLAELAAASDLPIPRIISGQEEAFLTYMGAVRGLGQSPSYRWRRKTLQGAIVVDIGGGSTEIIGKVNGGEFEPSSESLKGFSIDVGAVRLSEGFIYHDPISDEEYSTLIAHIRDKLAPVAEEFNKKESGGARLLVGVGGTATSAAAIQQELDEYSRDKVHGYNLTRSDVARILQSLKEMSLEARRRVKGLQPERADVIVAGMAILLTCMECLEANALVVSESDILEGLIYTAPLGRGQSPSS